MGTPYSNLNYMNSTENLPNNKLLFVQTMNVSVEPLTSYIAKSVFLVFKYDTRVLTKKALPRCLRANSNTRVRVRNRAENDSESEKGILFVTIS